MPLESDKTLYGIEAVLLTSVVVTFGLAFLLTRLRHTRSDMALALPLGFAVGIRVLAAMSVSLTSAASTLRGGDETLFLEKARDLAQEPLFSAAGLSADLHEWIFSLQVRLLDSPELAMRVLQIGIAVAGLALLATAVHDLAGPRASVAAAWFLAFEPTSIFFTGLLHKEPNMLLASGLVAYGGTRLWKRPGIGGVAPIVVGCLIALTTRPYVGWFLITAGALITLHAATRRPELASVGLVAAVALVAATFVVPFAFEATSTESLEENLQTSQDANTQRTDANLTLERVDYSSREDIILNLPTRVRDILFRPYPWQVVNLEQRVGLSGTLIALVVLWMLVAAVGRNRGAIMSRAGPLVYVSLVLLIAYSLSAGNAGTGFRYRTHLVAVAICLILVLRELSPARAPIAPVRPKQPSLGRAVAASAERL